MLMSNRDSKDSRDGRGGNTAVYYRANSGGDKLYYAFDDWGATFGKWGGFFSRDKWDADGFSQQTRRLVAHNGQAIRWGYRGKHAKDITSGVKVEDVRWLVTYLSAATDEEVRAGLAASGATPFEIDAYAKSIRDRITQLQHLSDSDMLSR
jgi:hypothetical protein